MPKITPKPYSGVRLSVSAFREQIGNSAGGDGDRLIFIKEDEKSLTFGDDRIREAVEKYNAKLLILDPMSSYIGDTCSMNNANETRAEFNHLIAVAKDTGCAIVIIAHMNKAIYEKE